VAPVLSRLIVTLKDGLRGLADERAHQLANLLHLPTVYLLLLGAALFALIGKTIYELACPEYIKCGSDYHQFRHSYSEALTLLAEDFVQLWTSSDSPMRENIKRSIKDALGTDLITDIPSHADAQTINNASQLRLEYPNRPMENRTGTIMSLLSRHDFGEEVFALLRKTHDECGKTFRLACAWCYCAAIGLIVLVVLLQIWWVCRAMDLCS
jgi:hypothetical protein